MKPAKTIVRLSIWADMNPSGNRQLSMVCDQSNNRYASFDQTRTPLIEMTLKGMSRMRAVIIALLIVYAPFCTNANAESTLIAGYVEKVWFNSNKIAFKAKLDTGAKTSSINSPNYEVFKRKGIKWVRFEVTNDQGDKFSVERKLQRYTRIRRAGIDLARRPVIKMKICVGGKTGMSEFTLADRSSMNYQVIIGRTFLSNRLLVDSSRAFLASDKCKQSD